LSLSKSLQTEAKARVVFRQEVLFPTPWPVVKSNSVNDVSETEPRGRTSSVLLWHNGKHGIAVEHLAAALKARGLTVRDHQHQDLGGTAFCELARTAVEQATAVVLAVDALALSANDEVRSVLLQASQGQIRVILAVVPTEPESPLPPELIVGREVIDLRQGLTHEGIDLLTSAITVNAWNRGCRVPQLTSQATPAAKVHDEGIVATSWHEVEPLLVHGISVIVLVVVICIGGLASKLAVPETEKWIHLMESVFLYGVLGIYGLSALLRIAIRLWKGVRSELKKPPN